jgi:hypothetical protein
MPASPAASNAQMQERLNYPIYLCPKGFEEVHELPE